MTHPGKLLLYAVAAVALLVVGSELRAHFGQKVVIERPYIARSTSRFKGDPVVQIPANLNVPVPSEKKLKKLRKDYNAPGLVAPPAEGEPQEGEVPIKEVRIPCPEGVDHVDVLTTLTPEGDVNLHVKPDAKGFFGLPLKWSGSLMVEKVFPADTLEGLDPQWHVRGEVGIKAIRVGRLTVFPHVALGRFGSLKYGAAGLTVQF